MAIKELIYKAGRLFSSGRAAEYEPLKRTDVPDSHVQAPGDSVIAHRQSRTDGNHSIEMMQAGFDRLAESLDRINENLTRQVEQNHELTRRIDELPRFLDNFPRLLDNQKQAVDEVVSQLKVQAIRQQSFTEAVEKIPQAADEQTTSIKDMAGQMAASAAVDAQIKESLVIFNSNVDKLKDNIEGQTDGILQMSKTFSASDRYLKYIINAQHKRFMWVFIAAMAVSVFTVLSLLIVIFLLK